tara:strand:+ start:1125 stop:2012 length:888 start_codon:yes stop_codon:yes gene_type:complete
MNEALKKLLKSETSLFSSEKIINTEKIASNNNPGCWRIKLENGKDYFAKILFKKDYQRLKFEANGLKKLRQFSDKKYIYIPKPIELLNILEYSILITEYLDLENGNQSLLGKGIAMIHKKSSLSNNKLFGWGEAGYIGLGDQMKGWDENWGDSYVNLRLKPQIKLYYKNGFKLDTIEDLLEKIKNYLNSCNCIPALVHGDLWSGNIATTNSNLGILIDPAVWWADREVDLSMSTLFGGFSVDFYSSYNEVWPLEKSWEDRIDIYNLYHLLNHANIFGGSYVNNVIKTIKRIENKL